MVCLGCICSVFAKTGALICFWIIHIKPTKSINLMIFQPKITLEMHCQTYNRQITEVLREKEALVEGEFFVKHTGETWEIATVMKLSKVLRNSTFPYKKNWDFLMLQSKINQSILSPGMCILFFKAYFMLYHGIVILFDFYFSPIK